ncbi:hypothetical protein [Mesoplasma lactucae]|uniref:Uncharacterized protein n=1 Tax=Mesoplasma lactucae ATCC 49193 TaxID=81460 RepID=A0A291IRI0_9MOLU|nr:hypothetical protein [Mesoplasma lactucae]ATG97383.1 hypothetical protein CP520_01245 [Mesoplasma lactucae ATCC 49193]ATZ20164.1 hypothetical protein MLACT_v1c03430 [Mesoplasma lactucae ATCC 49193]MCL8216913.1 hypothetical protein [Mesoplasma lactucae ATCC 49193]
MSYYQRNSFHFTDHGLQRCRERLNLQGKDEWEVRDEVNRLMKESVHSFETKKDLYVSVGKSRTKYFVINKAGQCIITVTNVSAEKQLSLMKHNY